MNLSKKYIGIWHSLRLAVLFYIFSVIGFRFFKGISAFYFSSALRVLFGYRALVLFCDSFETSWRDVIHFRNWKAALAAGIGIFVFELYYWTCLALIGGSVSDTLTPSLAFADLFLLQITTGFWEELCWRGLMLEGYFHQKRQTRWMRLLYALLTTVIFGLAHWDDGGLVNVIFAAAFSLACAAIYLKSHNILIPMVIHFVHDIFANFASYVEYGQSPAVDFYLKSFIWVVGLMFLLSLVSLLREEKE